MKIPKDLYDYFSALPRSPTHDYSVYVTHPEDDEMIDALAKKIRDNGEKEGYSEFQIVSFAASFVQSLIYTSDSEVTGFDEYPRYPLETLVDDGGDCEDTSILAASLIKALGYDVVLLIFSKTDTSEGHCAVGVAGEGGMPGAYYKYKERNYYYLETTGEGWEIGDIPPEFQYIPAHIYPMIPVPILTHSWTPKANGLYIQLEINVENLGSVKADGVYVNAGFDAGDNKVWNKEVSAEFSLDVNESAVITLNLKPPLGEYTRVIVQIVYGGYAVDQSYSKWIQL
jgi:hypothetical protein